MRVVLHRAVERPGLHAGADRRQQIGGAAARRRRGRIQRHTLVLEVIALAGAERSIIRAHRGDENVERSAAEPSQAYAALR